ncbi:MAG: hypothetical protein ACXVJB_10185 [Mucilaginibacter sp.]
MMAVKVIAGILISLFTIMANDGPSGPAYLTVPVYYAPKSHLSTDSTTVLLINQTDFRQAKISNQKKLKVLKAAAYKSIKCAETQLQQLPHVRVINLVDSADLIVNTDSIKHLATKYGAGHVLTLKGFSADITLSDVQSSSPYFNAEVHVDYKLYESNGLFYKNLRGGDSTLMPDVKYIFGFYAAQFIHPPIDQHGAFVDTSAQNATIDALKDYLYATITHDRLLYTDQFLMGAVSKMYDGDMDEAITRLKPYLQHKNAKKASKAAYDLAVAYEAKGDIETAIKMAQLSFDKFNNNYATDILKDLKDE